MLKNYLKIALRSLFKNKLHSFINIFGLGVAIGICILGYVNYKFSRSFDSFHKNGNNIYGILSDCTVDGAESQWSENPSPLGPAVKEDVPGVEAFTRIDNHSGTMRYNDKVFYEEFNFVDPSFLNMLSFPLIKGNTHSLDNPNNIIVSQEVAQKYWGEENPIGKSVTISMDSHEFFDFNISGVIQNPPTNTAFEYTVLIPYNRLQDIGGKEVNSWKNRTEACLIQLKENVSKNVVEEKLKAFLSQTNFEDAHRQVKKYYLEPLHRLSYIEDELSGREPFVASMIPVSVITPSVVALFVLILACFNFVNISISTSSKRLKEIGIRKTIGARKSQIIFQFMGENIILCIGALIAGLWFGDIFVSVYDKMWPDISLTLNYHKDSQFLLFIAGVIMLTAVMAAVYPAFFISRFSPVGIIKGKTKFVTKNVMLKITLATQFSLVIITLMAAIAVGRNADYYKTMDPGFRVDEIIQVPVHDFSTYRVYQNVVHYNKDILSIAGTENNIGFAPHIMNAEVANRKQLVWRFRIGDNYLQTMGVSILKGRDFDDNIQSDQSESIIVNKKFCELFGLDSPLGETVSLYPDGKRTTYNIIGVISDFHVRDIDNPVEPAVMVYSPPEQYTSMAVYFNKDNYQSVMEFLRKSWQQCFPNRPFEGFPLENIREHEIRIAHTISTVFIITSVKVILIIAMGLFALIALNIEKRTKEIAVRKILGASLSHISKIIMNEFIVLFLIAFFIAASFGSFLLSLMMGSVWKEYTGLGVVPIISGSLIVIAVAVFTFGLQLYKIRNANPIESMRFE